MKFLVKHEVTRTGDSCEDQMHALGLAVDREFDGRLEASMHAATVSLHPRNIVRATLINPKGEVEGTYDGGAFTAA